MLMHVVTAVVSPLTGDAVICARNGDGRADSVRKRDTLPKLE